MKINGGRRKKKLYVMVSVKGEIPSEIFFFFEEIEKKRKKITFYLGSMCTVCAFNKPYLLYY